MNENCDKTVEEWKESLNLAIPAEVEEEGRRQHRKKREANADGGRRLEDRKSIDWSKTDYMIPVKNQGACGSCWAFSATSVMEGVQAIKDGRPAIELSTQEAVDCTPNDQGYWCNGCNGGWMTGYWRWT